MLYACAARFDMTENLKIFTNFFGTKQDLNYMGAYKIFQLMRDQA